MWFGLSGPAEGRNGRLPCRPRTGTCRTGSTTCSISSEPDRANAAGSVTRSARGRGLGRALFFAGMEYLHSLRSADEVILYVEAANTEAVSLCETVGFTLDSVSRQFEVGTG